MEAEQDDVYVAILLVEGCGWASIQEVGPIPEIFACQRETRAYHKEAQASLRQSLASHREVSGLGTLNLHSSTFIQHDSLTH